MKRLGAEHGFEAMAEPLVTDGIGAWSSTRVRGLVAAGDLPGVRAILGRPHALSGTVNEGDKRGRTLGFRTAGSRSAGQVILAAGVLGTVDLLLKMKADPDGLPRLSDQVGASIRTNNEALIGVIAPDQKQDLTQGVAIGSISRPPRSIFSSSGTILMSSSSRVISRGATSAQPMRPTCPGEK